MGMTSVSTSRRSATPVLIVLAATVFAGITTEILPVGLLPVISQGLGTSESQVGLLVSAYAVMVAVFCIPMTALVARWSRRAVLATLLSVYALSNVVMALAGDYWVALGARLIGGLAHAGFFAAVFAAAVSLVPPAKAGRAMAIVSGGIVLALAFGVPLGTALGNGVWLALGVRGLRRCHGAARRPHVAGRSCDAGARDDGRRIGAAKRAAATDPPDRRRGSRDDARPLHALHLHHAASHLHRRGLPQREPRAARLRRGGHRRSVRDGGRGRSVGAPQPRDRDRAHRDVPARAWPGACRRRGDCRRGRVGRGLLDAPDAPSDGRRFAPRPPRPTLPLR